MTFSFQDVMDSILEPVVLWKDWYCPVGGTESNGFFTTALAYYTCFFPILTVLVHAIFFMLIVAEHVKSLIRSQKKSKQIELERWHVVARFLSLGLLMLEIFRLLPAQEDSPSRDELSVHSSDAVAWLTIFLALQREENNGRAIYRNSLKAWWVGFVILSTADLSATVMSGEIWDAVLDIVPLTCSLLMALSSFSGLVYSDRVEKMNGFDSAKTPLLSESLSDSEEAAAEANPVSSGFSRAGFVSVLAFLWLNPLLNIGIRRPLKITDVPLLDPIDAPKPNYVSFQEEWNRQRIATPPGKIPSMLWTLFISFSFFRLP